MSLVVAVACIAAGTVVIAMAAGGRSLFSSASPTPVAVHPHRHPSAVHRPSVAPPRPAPALQSAPIVIPPEPSTTVAAGIAPTTAPTVAGGPAETGQGTGGGGGEPEGGVAAVGHSRVAGAPLPVKAPPASGASDPSEVATVQVRTLPLYASPGAAVPTSTLASPNYLGATVVLLVTAYQPGWVQAYIPVRPNETVAWVPAADVSLSWVNEHVVVHLGAKTITLYRDDAPVFSAPVAPGAPDSPTPTGLFFVAFVVKVSDPGGPYGPYALGTSDFSGTYMTFEGGPGQIGIHGTDQPWVIGTDASHGCIRLYDKDITTLARQIVPGIPVEIEN